MVVQHPCHDPLSFDDVDDAVLRVNGNGTRVHYRTNTMPGSSGSPVLNRNLDLVALHHAGEPELDFWAPVTSRSRRRLVQRGHSDPPDREAPRGNGLSSVFGGDCREADCQGIWRPSRRAGRRVLDHRRFRVTLSPGSLTIASRGDADTGLGVVARGLIEYAERTDAVAGSGPEAKKLNPRQPETGRLSTNRS